MKSAGSSLSKSTPSPIKAPTPSVSKPVSKPTATKVKSPSLSSALSDTASMKFKSEEVMHEGIKDDPELQKRFKELADKVAKAPRKKLDLGKKKGDRPIKEINDEQIKKEAK